MSALVADELSASRLGRFISVRRTTCVSWLGGSHCRSGRFNFSFVCAWNRKTIFNIWIKLLVIFWENQVKTVGFGLCCSWRWIVETVGFGLCCSWRWIVETVGFGLCCSWRWILETVGFGLCCSWRWIVETMGFGFCCSWRWIKLERGATNLCTVIKWGYYRGPMVSRN